MAKARKLGISASSSSLTLALPLSALSDPRSLSFAARAASSSRNRCGSGSVGSANISRSLLPRWTWNSSVAAGCFGGLLVLADTYCSLPIAAPRRSYALAPVHATFNRLEANFDALPVGMPGWRPPWVMSCLRAGDSSPFGHGVAGVVEVGDAHHV